MAFRLALVGAGRMGATHARALASSRTVEIACVVEPSDLAAAGVGAPRATLDALPDVDGALVCVPTRFHLQVVTQLAELGLPILCEKPCGLTSGETRAIAALDTPLQVAYWRRFVPALRQLREHVLDGELGDVVFVSCAQLDELPPARGFRDPRSSGGIVVDMGVHELDELRWLTGQEITSVTGVSGEVGWDEPVDGDPELVQLALALDGGIAAAVTLGRRHPPGEVCRIEVIGLDGAERIEFVAPPDGVETIAAALRAQAEDFALGRGEGATVDDAVAAIEAAERAKTALGLP
ncbi:MAG: Gfo/Idh/MocA family oxidoreductase [Actinomycetota bacterium]|nr:Gfo/Idh/MocA family oxidoreductase [Actinomycetota bacterium]